jgi:C-terminal processing protease CtpA/Prc
MPGFRGERFDGAVIFDGENWHVVALADDSPLATAGLQSGDVISAIDGESRDPQALRSYLEDMANDASVALTVERDGETMEISVQAAALLASDGLSLFGGRFETLPFFNGRGQNIDPSQFGDMPFMGGSRLGVEFINLDETVAAEHDLSVTDGALITAVLDGSPAAEAGLMADDVVVAVGGDPVDAQRTLRERMLAYQAGDTVTLDVLRGGETLTLEVTLAEVDFNLGQMPRFFFGPNGPDLFNNGRIPRFFGPDRNTQPDVVPVPAEPNL